MLVDVLKEWGEGMNKQKKMLSLIFLMFTLAVFIRVVVLKNWGIGEQLAVLTVSLITMCISIKTNRGKK